MNNKESINHLANSIDIPKFKGRTTIQLFEEGKEVNRIEEENLVTDAVATIFRNLFFGNGNLAALTPIRNLFGGIYCFQNSLEESTSNIRPPSEIENPMIAFAGQESHSTSSPYRGNPNAIESGKITNGYRFVWDWNTSQGNGTIGALALTLSRFGNTGLISSDNLQSPLFFNFAGSTIKGPYGIGGSGTAFKREMAIQIPRSYNPDTGKGISVYPTSSSLEFIIVRANSSKFYINDSVSEFEEVNSTTVNLTSSKNPRYSALVEDDSYYYYIYISSSGTSSVAMDRINKNDYSIISQDFSIPSGAIARFDSNNNLSISCNGHPYIVYDGKYLYLPSTDYSFYKVEMANPANVVKLSGNLSSWISLGYSNPLTGAVAINESLIAGVNFIINGNRVTETSKFSPDVDGSVATAFEKANTYPVFVKQSIANSEGARFNRGPGILPYLGTINNLSSPVTKTPSQTMKITYDITQVVD